MRVPPKNVLIIYAQPLYCEHARESKTCPAADFFPVKKVERQYAHCSSKEFWSRFFILL